MNNIIQKEKPAVNRFTPWISSLVILPLAIYYTINMGKFTFIDYVNLLIHEGGHGIFRVFGGYIYTLGGSLMQIIIPSLFVYYYAHIRKKTGFQLSMIWLGENLINISVYAADARTRRLPLLGGNKVYHDWAYLLGRINMLEYDDLIGKIFYFTGIIIFIISLLAPIYIKVKPKPQINLDL